MIRSRQPVGHFFLIMALLCLVVALAGFGPGFLRAVATDISAVPFYVHFHGIVMMGWLCLFAMQAWLGGRRRLPAHRALGKAGAALFILVIATASIMSLNNLLKPVPPPVDVLLNNLFMLQSTGIIFAIVLFSLAMAATRGDLQAHKRYMLILTLLLIEAAFARMLWLPGGNVMNAGIWPLHLYHGALFLPLIIYDLVTLKRLHRATLIGLAMIVAGKLASLWAWNNPFWQACTARLEAGLLMVWVGL